LTQIFPQTKKSPNFLKLRLINNSKFVYASTCLCPHINSGKVVSFVRICCKVFKAEA
jgi:hypothetical protein